jgi:hypothetical protein
MSLQMAHILVTKRIQHQIFHANSSYVMYPQANASNNCICDRFDNSVLFMFSKAEILVIAKQDIDTSIEIIQYRKLSSNLQLKTKSLDNGISKATRTQISQQKK